MSRWSGCASTVVNDAHVQYVDVLLPFAKKLGYNKDTPTLEEVKGFILGKSDHSLFDDVIRDIFVTGTNRLHDKIQNMGTLRKKKFNIRTKTR